jgi:hypothetical protein
VNGTRLSPRNNRLLHPRLDPRQTSGPRCFYSTTRATINNLSKLASNLPPPSDKTPPYAPDSFRARPHLLGSHRILASVRPACHASPRSHTDLIARSPRAPHLHLSRRRPIASPNCAQVPADASDHPPRITPPQWRLQRPSPSRCARQPSRCSCAPAAAYS